ncbi:MAG: methylmalonyl Co-A mutase-associated GTPase MeaB [Dehalococcoidales bacterium]|nr:methylmalonyl Co-A mutase-associated GTPase MeaB [Dehalococcoidales bacterium]
MDFEQIQKIIDGDVLTAARLIRDIENGKPDAADVLEGLLPYSGKAHIVGVTGAAGSGKSTLLGKLIRYFRKEKDMTVGVVAVDPSSPVTGGAFLGDRLRMQGEQVDPGLFIRSLASRGRTGGISDTAEDVLLVMDAMGKDVVFIEAVGSGQADVDIAGITDTCIGIVVPGMGDDIQLMKAGIMEIAHIFAVNKADHEGAENLKAMLQAVLGMRGSSPSDWKPPVILTEARSGKGVDELGQQIIRHREFLISSGQIEE